MMRPPTGRGPGCAEWRRVADAWLAERRAGESVPDAGLAAHLGQCRACRRRVLAADPTALFTISRVASGFVAGPATTIEGDAEVESMLVAVRNLRRAQALDSRRGAGRAFGRRAVPRRARFAAAAVLAIGLATAWSLGPSSEPAPAPVSPWTAAAQPAFAEGLGDWRLAPLVETIGRPEARVYEFGDAAWRAPGAATEGDDGGLSVVLIVDETLDV